MKVRVYSDTHLDHHKPNKLWYPPELPDDKETTLIIAGDLWFGTNWIEYAGESWIGKVAPRFKNVIVVLGNHDYWPMGNSISIKNGALKCNTLLQDMGFYNVHVLDCSTFEDEGVLFVGSTLWTDMFKGDSLAMYNMPRVMNYDGKIAFETGPNGQWARFTSERWVMQHDRHKNYIKHVVEQNRNKKIVVVTHHLPLMTLCDPMFLGDSSNAYYASDMSDFILDNEHIAMWCYGHTHSSSDMIFGATRMINNCVGYKAQNFEQLGWVKHEVIELC